MRTKPILFSTQMVKAIINGNKTVTRRLPNARWRNAVESTKEWAEVAPDGLYCDGIPYSDEDWERKVYAKHPPYCAGDILWVRETWASAYLNGGLDGFIDAFAYKADGALMYYSSYHGKLISSSRKVGDLHSNAISAWRPSIFMPKEAARIFLRVTDTHLERLRVITDVDAIDEGMLDYDGWQTDEYKKAVKSAKDNKTLPPLGFTPRERFAHIWDALRKPCDRTKCGWDANPYVWAIRFERCGKPGDF